MAGSRLRDWRDFSKATAKSARIRVRIEAMKSLFLFCKGGIEVSVLDGFDCHEVRSRKAYAVEDEAAAVSEALDHPIACEPLPTGIAIVTVGGTR